MKQPETAAELAKDWVARYQAHPIPAIAELLSLLVQARTLASPTALWQSNACCDVLESLLCNNASHRAEG